MFIKTRCQESCTIQSSLCDFSVQSYSAAQCHKYTVPYISNFRLQQIHRTAQGEVGVVSLSCKNALSHSPTHPHKPLVVIWREASSRGVLCIGICMCIQGIMFACSNWEHRHPQPDFPCYLCSHYRLGQQKAT